MAKRRRRKKNNGLISFLSNTFFPVSKTAKTKRAKHLEEQWKLEVSENIAREIWAVVSLSTGALIILSFTNQLGLPGEWINSLLKPIFGVGLFILPLFLFATSILLFFSKQLRITMAKLTGASIFVISLLSIVHLSVPEESIAQFAIDGRYGGYLGFLTNYFFRIILKIGNLGSAIIFIASFLISLLLTFEISIKELLSKQSTTNLKQPTLPKTAKPVMPAVTPDFGNIEEDTEINIIKPEPIKITPQESRTHSGLQSTSSSTPQTTHQKDPVDTQANLFTDGVATNTEYDDSAEDGEATLEEDYIDWEYPSYDLLDNDSSKVLTNDKLLKQNAEKIRSKLKQFDIAVTMGNVHVGPTVVQYTLKPSEGVKLSKITNLKNDLALALAAKSIRMEAPIPGKGLVGIELPSEQRMVVKLREMMESEEFTTVAKNSKLAFPLGRDVTGKPITTELSDMPHLLIAGATGAGKSVAINTFLISLLFQNSPAELKFIMVDPKQVELRDYNGIPHLLTPVITDPDKAANALKWAVAEMNRRYQTLSHSGCRNIDEYNSDLEKSKDGKSKRMPKIIVLIDELADLMMANGKEVEASICRLAQMARAVGIHLIIATQRPSVDVITGLIKANIPTRISFAVTSSIDSRTILDSIGAEELLGRGDMLYLQKDFAKPMRIQGIYISPLEIKKVTNKLKISYEPDYKEEITEKISSSSAGNSSGNMNEEDELYTEAFEVIVESQKASASLLQRKLRIGYARAARLLDLLEEQGVIGPVNGAKAREIYINK